MNCLTKQTATVIQKVGLATLLIKNKNRKMKELLWIEFVETWNALDVSFSYTGLLLGKDRNPKKDVVTLW